MYKQKIKNGISLIVLVITIVVMIVLSATIILIVDDSTIVRNASKAAKESDTAKAKEIIMMAKTDWRTNQRQIHKEGFKTFKSYAESRLAEFGFSIGNNAGEVEVTETGMLYQYKVPVIPDGFTASDVETEDEVSEGLVIYEGHEAVTGRNVEEARRTRNQFVWVPVPNMTEFVLMDGYLNGILQKHVALEEVSEPCLASILSLTAVDIKTDEYSEYNAMRASIEKYGGFYIGRYEAGTTVSRTNTSNRTSVKEDGITPDILVLKEKPVYNYVGWGPSMVDVQGDVLTDSFNQGLGAVKLARTMYPNSNIVSHLIYGIEWDSVIRFINEDDYMKNSSMFGNYLNYNQSVENTKTEEGAGSLKTTGTSENWEQKNIYDLAGNVTEWTMEAFHGAVIGRTARGGCAKDSGINYPVSNRIAYATNYNEELLGFRVALYLK